MLRPAVAALALLAATSLSAAPLPPASPLTGLASKEVCNRCTDTLLPGRLTPHPETKWGIISDLPESFLGYGVLYSTRDILPENGGTAEMRAQRKARGFQFIDSGFDVFLFHLIAKDPGQSARIVVYVRNLGTENVTLLPEQAIKSEGVIGTVHEFESTLGKRVLGEGWDRPLSRVLIPSGQGRIVAFGKRFGNVQNGPDSSRNVNCFGYARVRIAGDRPAKLQVDVIAIPATERDQMAAEAEKWKDSGVKSTDEVPMDREQQGCALGRAVGVYPNFVWKNDPIVLDVTRLSEAGTSFPMALPAIQTAGCAEARQTQDLVLRPGYTREDTIGNYMIPYDVRLTLVNPATTETVSADVVFGKTGADIGLAYQAVVARTADGDPYQGAKVESHWAGPKQKTRERSFLAQPVTLKPGEKRVVALRFLICGNSSLPFQLGVKKTR